MNIEDRLAAIRKNLESAKLSRAKAQRDKELAEQSKSEYLRRLKNEYNVDSTIAAKELLNTLESTLEETLTRAEEKLKEAQGDV